MTTRVGAATGGIGPPGRLYQRHALERPTSRYPDRLTPQSVIGCGSVDRFQVHGVDTAGQVVIRRQLRRRHVLAFFQKLPPCLVIRCRITASLRARATFAHFEPRRLATSIPQRLSFENRVMRDSRTLVASYNTVRTVSSPANVIPPVTSFSPD